MLFKNYVFFLERIIRFFFHLCCGVPTFVHTVNTKWQYVIFIKSRVKVTHSLFKNVRAILFIVCCKMQAFKRCKKKWFFHTDNIEPYCGQTRALKSHFMHINNSTQQQISVTGHVCGMSSIAHYWVISTVCSVTRLYGHITFWLFLFYQNRIAGATCVHTLLCVCFYFDLNTTLYIYVQPIRMEIFVIASSLRIW